VAAPTPARWVRPLVWFLAAFLAIAGTAAAVLLVLALRMVPDLERMVPASVDAYGVVSLDPPLGQKMNLLRLAHQFPSLKTDADLTRKVDETIDRAIHQEGVSFGPDVRPWLGSQVGMVMRLTDPPAGVLLVTSKDDSKAKALLARVRSLQPTKSWRDIPYRGVTITVGLPAGAQEETDTARDARVYAVVDHVVLVGNSRSLIEEIIDTAQGKRARLRTSSDYLATLSRLPAERLVTVYVNGQAIGSRARDGARRVGRVQVPANSLQTLDALQGIGFAVVARPTGLAGDLEVAINAANLDPATRDSLTVVPHRNPVLDWIPKRTYGFMAASGGRPRQSLETSLRDQFALRQSLEQFGLLGPTGLLQHLTGDSGFEVEPGVGKYPAGALLVGTDDPVVTRRFLDRVTTLLLSQFPTSPSLKLAVKQETYQGVEISSITVPELSEYGIAPAYAVTGGFAIIASSPAEIKALIDTRAFGDTIAKSERFATVTRESLNDPNTVFYVDMVETANAVRALLPPQPRDKYEAEVAPDLAPLKAFISAARTSPERLKTVLFVLIG